MSALTLDLGRRPALRAALLGEELAAESEPSRPYAGELRPTAEEASWDALLEHYLLLAGRTPDGPHSGTASSLADALVEAVGARAKRALLPLAPAETIGDEGTDPDEDFLAWCDSQALEPGWPAALWWEAQAS